MNLIAIVLIALMLAVVLANVIFRARILSKMKYLSQHGVDFPWYVIFNRSKRSIIHKKFPNEIDAIERFCLEVRRSIRWMIILFATIALIGSVLYVLK